MENDNKCPNGNIALPGEVYCDVHNCQSCCEHNEFDHFICLDCGYEKDPGQAIDEAMDHYDY